jgi:ABC-type Fe3+ transport system substrate-binding protein
VVEAVRNGAPSGMDVFWTTAENIETLQRGGALAQFDWTAALGIDPALKFGEVGLRAHDGMLTNVTYNTDLVKPDQAPKSYHDLLDPKWKERIAAPRSPGPWVNLSYALGEKETADLLTALVKTQRMRILPRYPDVLARVINGEFPLGIGTEAFIEMRKKAPVANANLDIMVVAPWGFTITKDAKHPALAKLWGYWATTKDGQSALDRIRGISVVTAEGTDVARFAQGKKVFIVPYDYMVKNSQRLAKEYGEILGVVR